MNKEKLVKTVRSHYGLFRFLSGAYNRLNPRNKLGAKGLKLKAGVCVIRGLKIKSSGKNNEVVIGDFARLKGCRIHIEGDNNRIVIGDWCYLADVEFYIEDSGNKIELGEHCQLSGKTHLAAIEGTSITIGKDCLFSSDIHFRTGDSHSLLNLDGERINPSADIVIGDHVWIGTKVTCLKGVHVADNSVVAATTTLVKAYGEENAVIAGVPGRVVKTGVSWCKSRIKIEKDK
ncbi:MAG: acyltransferase [Clostridia bacterium]|nr:acyltransferase [Clostridia bacterium]